MMTHRSIRIAPGGILVLALLLLVAPAADAQRLGAGKALRELFEKAAVREAAEETVEETAERTGRSAARKSAPDDAPASPADRANLPAAVRPAQAADAAGEALSFAQRHGDEAVKAVQKHPGVGGELVEAFDAPEATTILLSLDQDTAIQLSRFAEELSRLPRNERLAFLQKVKTFPERFLQAVENAPNVTRAGARVATVSIVALGTFWTVNHQGERLLGPADDDGFVIRFAKAIHLDYILGFGIALVVLAWFLRSVILSPARGFGFGKRWSRKGAPEAAANKPVEHRGPAEASTAHDATVKDSAPSRAQPQNPGAAGAPNTKKGCAHGRKAHWTLFSWSRKRFTLRRRTLE